MFFNFHKQKKSALPPLKNGKVLPESISHFQACHYKVLRRLNNHPVKEVFTGYMALEVDIPNFIPILLQLGLIRIGTYEEALSSLKIDALKNILRSQDLKISGNKNVLLERILTNIDQEVVQKMDVYSDIYLHTELATKIISESYESLDRIELDFFEQILKLIIDEQLDKAFRLVCKRNAEKPVPPGLWCDWERWYLEGIKPSDKQLYLEFLHKNGNNQKTAAAIYSQFSSESIMDISQKIKKILSADDCSVDSYIRTQSRILSCERDFKQNKSFGIERYKFLATLDTRTCPICGELDGKIFLVSEREMGVNCPPMHDG